MDIGIIDAFNEVGEGSGDLSPEDIVDALDRAGFIIVPRHLVQQAAENGSGLADWIVATA